MNTNLTESLDLFFGDANPAETRVYARLSGSPDCELQLAGSLTGPYCEYAQTLPAKIPFVDLGRGPSPLAQAVVPDPCFWTPELPYLYRARIEVKRGPEVLASIDREFGIRPLGARGQRFYYAGKPWVLRGVHRPVDNASELPDCRDADAALFLDDPDEKLCMAASRQGVLIVANLSGSASPDNIRRLARHASVGFIVINAEPPGVDVRSLAPNVIFVRPHETQSSSAQAVLCPIEKLTSLPMPVIAYRPAPTHLDIHQQRALCDRLQRDLAGGYEAAGFLV